MAARVMVGAGARDGASDAALAGGRGPACGRGAERRSPARRARRRRGSAARRARQQRRGAARRAHAGGSFSACRGAI